MHPEDDKLNVLTSMFIFAAQMGMIWIGNAETGASVVPENEGIKTEGFWVGVTEFVCAQRSIDGGARWERCPRACGPPPKYFEDQRSAKGIGRGF
jgi:hypothetical protein